MLHMSCPWGKYFLHNETFPIVNEILDSHLKSLSISTRYFPSYFYTTSNYLNMICLLCISLLEYKFKGNGKFCSFYWL